MADKRIYAGYYKRYDGKHIYVVTMAKDSDTDEDMVIWTPVTYSESHQYFTMSKKSFCEDVIVDGKRRAKYKRQTQMKAAKWMAESYEADGFRGPMRRGATRPEKEQVPWRGICAANYDEYAKILCEDYRFLVAKYSLCVEQKRYIGIGKEDFIRLKEDLSFLKSCLKTVLKEYREYFEARFVQGLSIRKYAEAHQINRGSVDHLQRKFFTALAQVLKERDEAEGKHHFRLREQD